MINVFKKIIDIIFPNNIKCFACGKEILKKESYCVCNDCKNMLPFINKPCKTCGEELTDTEEFCLRCKNIKRYFTKAVASFSYKNALIPLIHSFKYNNARWLAKHFADYMFDTLSKNKLLNIDYIIPVPLCVKHKKQRGYNQSEILCKELLSLFKSNNLQEVKLLDTALIRVKETLDQVELNAKERIENMNGAFDINIDLKNNKLLKNKKVLLVDDVFTTGATTEECSKVLKKAGAAEVYIVTVCHTKFKST